LPDSTIGETISHCGVAENLGAGQTAFLESIISRAPWDIPSKQEVAPIFTHRIGKGPPVFLVVPRFGKNLAAQAESLDSMGERPIKKVRCGAAGG
jgi:hypothetical protein